MVKDDTYIVHIEICQKPESSLEASTIEKELDEFLTGKDDLPLDKLLYDTVLPQHISYVRLCCSVEDLYKVNLSSEKVIKKYYTYQTWSDGPQVDSLDEDNGEVPASLNWCMPNTSFEGLWECLILENEIKDQLLNYVQTILQYSDKNVNSQVISWNGVILLHGPPGSGKTSLCKALAQKLSIRLNSKYKTTQLLEINTHSLFSKWFSESAKLVLKMFTSVKQWLQSTDNFVCILIDEVESLAHVRQAKGTEPSDSIRVVNAVLTQIDQLQKYPNVLILATSNVTSTIDVAFADRADLKLFVPHPEKWGTYEIFRSCVEELIKCDLVDGDEHEFLEAGIYKKLLSNEQREGDGNAMNTIMNRSRTLMYISALGNDLSGRTLRKIPFLASAKFVDKPKPRIDKYLDALRVVVCSVKEDNERYFSSNWGAGR